MIDNKTVMQQALNALPDMTELSSPMDERAVYGYTADQMQAYALAAIAQPVPPGLAERIQREIDHCVMNDIRLAPFFGKRKGDLAVRVSSLEAILETSAEHSCGTDLAVCETQTSFSLTDATQAARSVQQAVRDAEMLTLKKENAAFKAVMQQALDALIEYHYARTDLAEALGNAAVFALREAIAQTEQPKETK